MSRPGAHARSQAATLRGMIAEHERGAADARARGDTTDAAGWEADAATLRRILAAGRWSAGPSKEQMQRDFLAALDREKRAAIVPRHRLMAEALRDHGFLRDGVEVADVALRLRLTDARIGGGMGYVLLMQGYGYGHEIALAGHRQGQKKANAARGTRPPPTAAQEKAALRAWKRIYGPDTSARDADRAAAEAAGLSVGQVEAIRARHRVAAPKGRRKATR